MEWHPSEAFPVTNVCGLSGVDPESDCQEALNTSLTAFTNMAMAAQAGALAMQAGAERD